jgi:phosphatidylglycerol:prolipoprotein diacylglycerol transferase
VALGLLLWLAARRRAQTLRSRHRLWRRLWLARIFCEFFREPDPAQEALPNGLTMGMVLLRRLFSLARRRSCSRCA